MKGKEIMLRDIETIDFSSSISDAAEKMRSSDIGVLSVEKDGRIIGIVTDKDVIIRGLAMHLDPEKTSVCKVMTPYVTASDDDNLKDSLSIMEEKHAVRSEESLLYCG